MSDTDSSTGSPNLADRALLGFQRKLRRLFLCRSGLATLTTWTFSWACVVLGARIFLGVEPLFLLWGLFSALLLLPVVYFLATRQLPPLTVLRATLDRHSRCGGLLMAGAEVQTKAWDHQLPSLSPPKVYWNPRRSLALFAGACIFLLVSYLVPVDLEVLTIARLNTDRQVQRLRENFTILKEEKILREDRAEELQKNLEQVRQNAVARDPGKTLEALDHLDATAKKHAHEAVERMTRQREQAAKAEAIADLLRKSRQATKELDNKALAQGMSELARLTRKASENDLIKAELNKELQDVLDKLEALASDGLSGVGGPSNLTDEQLEQLAKALREGLKLTDKQANRLHKAQLIDGKQLEQCEQAGECNMGELLALLNMSSVPGRDVSRGPGAAELSWRDPVSKQGVKFQEQELPASELRALETNELSGISRAVPKVGKTEPSMSGALDGARAEGGAATTPILLPRHRKTVERYFDRAKK